MLLWRCYFWVCHFHVWCQFQCWVICQFVRIDRYIIIIFFIITFTFATVIFIIRIVFRISGGVAAARNSSLPRRQRGIAVSRALGVARAARRH